MKRAELDLPAGFRFHPTDEELVNHYLIKRCAGQEIDVPIIAEIDLYKFDPWELPDMALYGEKEWYFFSPRDRKYPNGSRPNRAAGNGYWKATGADKPIGRPMTLGIKKALVFYAGKAPKGVKTNWIMHEYRLANVDRSAGKKTGLRLDDRVLCRIYNKKGRVEVHSPIEQKVEYQTEQKLASDFPEIDVKPEIWMLSQNYYAPPLLPQPAPQMSQPMPNDVLHMDTSESIPRLHPDSSCSEHVVSPDFTGDREVESVPKWNQFDKSFDLQFSSMESFLNDSFTSHAQIELDEVSPFQDVFMGLQKPF